MLLSRQVAWWPRVMGAQQSCIAAHCRRTIHQTSAKLRMYDVPDGTAVLERVRNIGIIAHIDAVSTYLWRNSWA